MVFVTGATGLIGSFLLLELTKRNQSIRALKRKNSSIESVKNLFLEYSDLESFEKIEWVESDLLDIPKLIDVLRGIQTIYHTAAIVGFDDRSKEQIHHINVLGTENMVNLAISEKVPEFVFVSSIAVLDPLPEEKEISEYSKWDPEKAHSEYSISKKKAEMSVWRGSQEGLNVLVVHPSVVIGSLDGSRASEKIFELAYKKNAYATNGLTGYVDVRDVAYCMAELVNQQKWNASFLLNSQTKTFSEIFNFLRKNANQKEAKKLTGFQLNLTYYASKISKIFGGPYMSKASLAALTGKLNYSNLKIKNTLEIDFISIEEALEFHSKYYKKKIVR